MLTESLIAECTQMARLVAPELAARPLYVLNAAELPWLPPAAGDCLGFAIPDFVDCNVVDALGDRWQGAGPVIILQPCDFRPKLLQTMLHELGHVLPAKCPADMRDLVDDPAKFKTWQHQKLAVGLALPDLPMGDPDDCHDHRFVRRCLHLFTRATAAGYDVPLHGLFQLPTMTWPAHFLPLVLREAQVMRGHRFSEIEQTPAPEDFLAMWNDCLALYHKYQRPQ